MSFHIGPVALAATQHDPEGRLVDQIRRALPALRATFGQVVVQATRDTQAAGIELLRAAGARVFQETTGEFSGLARLGGSRRSAVELALATGAEFVLYCDFDRALHWAEYHLAELARVAAQIPRRDLTVFGRSARAFADHPRIQRDTETIINGVFARCSGHEWDITAAARGLSRRAAAAILAGCPDQTIGTDMSWPLFLLRQGEFTSGYYETEGLEFETADRFAAEIAAAGGRERWMQQLDASPAQWAFRLELARIEVEAAVPYTY